MKKILITLVILTFIVGFSANTLSFAWIGDFYESEDDAFLSIMTEMKEDQVYNYDSYTYSRMELKNTSGELSGYVYDITLDGITDGFIMMIKVVGGYEVTEVFVNAVNPFRGVEGLCIYPTFLKYFSFQENVYMDLTLNAEISEEYVLFLEDWGFGFNGEGSSVPYSETIYYSTRSVQTNQITYRIPALTVGPSLGNNACAVIAGGNIISYWDYWRVNLMPNYSPVSYIYNGVYYWKSNNTTTATLMNDLYVAMETNVGGPGTTISGFKNGLISYASSHGSYSVSYYSTMTSGVYDVSKMVTQFSNNRPVVLFLYPYYNFLDIASYSGMDVISGGDYTASHTMVAYGRQINTYYNSGGQQIRQITFLKVAGCASSLTYGLVRLNEGSLSIQDSFAIQIT